MRNEIDHEHEAPFGREPEDDREGVLAAMQRGAGVAVTTGEEPPAGRVAELAVCADERFWSAEEVAKRRRASLAAAEERERVAAAGKAAADPSIARVVALMVAMTPEQRKALATFAEMVPVIGTAASVAKRETCGHRRDDLACALDKGHTSPHCPECTGPACVGMAAYAAGPRAGFGAHQ